MAVGGRADWQTVSVPNREKSPTGRDLIQQAQAALSLLGFDRARSNERSALILLGLLGLRPGYSWTDATRDLHPVTSLINWTAKHFDKYYAPNTREAIRRQTLHQFIDASLVLSNPDDPSRPSNNSKGVYQVEESAFVLLCQFGTPQWDKNLPLYLDFPRIEGMARRVGADRWRQYQRPYRGGAGTQSVRHRCPQSGVLYQGVATT